MYCEKCGAEIKATDKFCIKCGTPIAGNSMPVTNEQPASREVISSEKVPVKASRKNTLEPRDFTQNQKNDGHKIILIGGGIVVVLAALLVVGVFHKSKPVEAESKSVETLAVARTEPMVMESEPEMTAVEESEMPKTEAVSTEVQTQAPETTAKANITYETMYVINCNESITLRTSPSTKAAEIRQIPFGEAVSYIEGAEDGFYKISYLGSTGYALASYLSKEQPSYESRKTNNAVSYVTMWVVNCNESITLRTSPSTKAAEIRQIPLGEAVSYIESAANGFCKISYLGQTGYALASFLSNEEPYYGNVKADSYYYEQVYVTMRVANCNESITLRTSPSTKASAICQIPLGEVVSYIEPAANGFYKISYLGQTGYALASYLEYE